MLHHPLQWCTGPWVQIMHTNVDRMDFHYVTPVCYVNTHRRCNVSIGELTADLTADLTHETHDVLLQLVAGIKKTHATRSFSYPPHPGRYRIFLRTLSHRRSVACARAAPAPHTSHPSQLIARSVGVRRVSWVEGVVSSVAGGTRIGCKLVLTVRVRVRGCD
eukprot:3060730-Prymnesium_polylepis.1